MCQASARISRRRPRSRSGLCGKEAQTDNPGRGPCGPPRPQTACPRPALLAVLLALTASQAAGLNASTALSQYGRDVWDSDSGLPQNSVDAILQTKDGYL